MENDARSEQDSLAPLSLEGASLEADIERLRMSREGLLWRWLGLVLMLGLAAGLTVQAMDAAQAREEARAQLGRLSATHLQGFLDCAAPDARPVRITSQERLHSLLERQVDVVPGFGQRLADCLPDLLAFRRGLSSMPVPTEVEAEHQHMIEAVEKLYVQVDNLATALIAQPELDYVRSTGLVGRITSAHQAFVDTRQRWNTEMAF